jgi:hypothetical protein
MVPRLAEVHTNHKKGLAGTILAAEHDNAVQGQDALKQVLGDFKLLRNEALE